MWQENTRQKRSSPRQRSLFELWKEVGDFQSAVETRYLALLCICDLMLTWGRCFKKTCKSRYWAWTVNVLKHDCVTFSAVCNPGLKQCRARPIKQCKTELRWKHVEGYSRTCYYYQTFPDSYKIMNWQLFKRELHHSVHGSLIQSESYPTTAKCSVPLSYQLCNKCNPTASGKQDRIFPWWRLKFHCYKLIVN